MAAAGKGEHVFKIPSKHQQAALDIAASAAEFKEQANDGVANRFATVLEPGETSPDFLFAQELIGRLLGDVYQNLENAGSAQTSQLVAAAALRVQRDRVTVELRLRLRDARQLLDELVTSATARTVLPIRRFSNMAPAMLVQSARDVITALRNPNLGLETEPSMIFDATKLAATLETKANELASLLDQLAPQARATQAELGNKLAEIKSGADTHRRCADFLYGLYRLAGLDFHADRLRPK